MADLGSGGDDRVDLCFTYTSATEPRGSRVCHEVLYRQTPQVKLIKPAKYVFKQSQSRINELARHVIVGNCCRNFEQPRFLLLIAQTDLVRNSDKNGVPPTVCDVDEQIAHVIEPTEVSADRKREILIAITSDTFRPAFQANGNECRYSNRSL
jgi:hypothetical protein